MPIDITDTDRERIEAAVASAEEDTSGEIVVYVMAKSDYYDVAYLRAASMFALLAMGAGLVTIRLYDGWGLGWLHQSWGFSLLVVGAALLGVSLVAVVSPFKRWLVGAERLRRTVRLQAYRAFVEEGVFSTRDGTGILLLVSLFEHRVEVLADKGINQQVDGGAWTDVVNRVIHGIREDRLADGLVAGVEMCGELLRQHGIAVRPDDRDEVSDRLRTRDSP